MDFESVKSWLTRWTERQAANCWWKGVFGLVLTPIALAISLALIFGLSKLALHDERNNPGDTKTCLWVTLAILPFLFIANRFTPHRDLVEERMREGPDDSFIGRAVERREVLILCFLWIVFTGPRLVDWAISSFRQMRRFRKMDTHSCAAVLWLALVRGKKVPYGDLQRDFDWLNLDTVLPEIGWIHGVVFLKNPPPGLSITDDLRSEIRSEVQQAATVASSA